MSHDAEWRGTRDCRIERLVRDLVLGKYLMDCGRDSKPESDNFKNLKLELQVPSHSDSDMAVTLSESRACQAESLEVRVLCNLYLKAISLRRNAMKTNSRGKRCKLPNLNRAPSLKDGIF